MSSRGSNTGGGAGAIVSVPTGGGAATTLVPNAGFVTDLTVDATNLYWSSNGIKQMPLAGGTTHTLYTGNSSYTLANDGAHVYTTTFDPNLPLGGNLVSVPIGGGTVSLPAGGYGEVAVDARYIYYTTYNQASINNSTIARIPVGGGSPVTLYTGAEAYTDLAKTIAIDATYVYLSGYESGQIVRVPIAGGAPLVLAQSGLPEGLAVDSSYVYWVTTGGEGTVNGACMKVPIGGGTPITVASGLDFPVAVAVDSTSVYIVDMAMRRPPSIGGSDDTGLGSLVKVTPK
jgi:hypothetical protein